VKLIRRGERTEGVSETCEYHVFGVSCGDASAGELRAHRMGHPLPWGMCGEHVKPEHHPPDLRDKLHRW
jgi:hypothetical protein